METRKTKFFCVGIGILIVMLSASITVADFYLIGGGKKAKKTILVSSKSSPAASGTALLNAINGITFSSSTCPYLILIEPGIYDIGTNSLQMKEYVDIQGSGEDVTTIIGSRSDCVGGVVNGSNNAEIRFLTIKHNAGGECAIGIENNDYSPSITHVTINIANAEFGYGVSNSSSSPKLNNININITYGTEYSHGVYNTGNSNPVMNNVRIYVSGGNRTFGVYNVGNSIPKIANSHIVARGAEEFSIGIFTSDNGNNIIRIDRCFIRGSDEALRTQSGETTFIGNSRLSGDYSVTGSGTHKCAVVYNHSFQMLNSDCSSP